MPGAGAAAARHPAALPAPFPCSLPAKVAREKPHLPQVRPNFRKEPDQMHLVVTKQAESGVDSVSDSCPHCAVLTTSACLFPVTHAGLMGVVAAGVDLRCRQGRLWLRPAPAIRCHRMYSEA